MSEKLRVLDLFAGIGGFSLGLERTGGFETVAFCEIEEFPRKVLRKHWPHVPIYKDVRDLTADRLAADGITVDVITGGFPCQDVSLAGNRKGLDGERSGLWVEIKRLVCELGPSYLLVENTPGLLSLGMGTVLYDLATIGYDAEWHCVPAAYIGADHIRDRVWIVSYPIDGESKPHGWTNEPPKEMAQNASNALCSRLSRGCNPFADREDAPDISKRIGLAIHAENSFPREYREHKPVLGRGLHGVPNRVDRIKALGNAVVPQVVTALGEAILEAEYESLQ